MAATTTKCEWEALASLPSPSWYLDRLVAEQKRSVHQELVRRWTRGVEIRRVLKTDVFEEANGPDQILFDLFPAHVAVLGIDVAWQTVWRARDKCPHPGTRFLASDIRNLPLRPDSIDVIVSASTLDHFDAEADFVAALEEVSRVLRPGGVMVITLDNPSNPLYGALRWASRHGWAPFRLGYTPTLAGLVRHLEQTGLEVSDTDVLIHNVRGVSTLLFLALRRLLGRRADAPIRMLMAAFAAFGRLPTRRFTACFVAACARRPDAGQP